MLSLNYYECDSCCLSAFAGTQLEGSEGVEFIAVRKADGEVG